MNKYTYRGSLYEKRRCWYWKVALPGDERRRTIALHLHDGLPVRSRGVAKEVAQRMWEEMAGGHLIRLRSLSTVGELIAAYRAHLSTAYPETSDMPSRIDYALDLIDKHEQPVDEFGPLRLEEVRAKMLGKGLGVRIVNERTQFIRKMFQWAASRELVRPEVPFALRLLENLTGQETGVKPAKDREPVQLQAVAATLPALTPTVRDMVRLQLLTGMRPGELVIMRPIDIDRTRAPWVYQPKKHKNQWRGKKHVRRVILSAEAQCLLAPRLETTAPDDYLFKPAVSAAESRPTRLTTCQTLPGPYQTTPGSARRFRSHYTKDSYRRAIERACDKAFPIPDNLNNNKAASAEWQKSHRWTPYQLRHTTATLIREALGDKGLSAVQAMLGQKSFDVAEMYARLDGSLAHEAARVLDEKAKIG